MRNAGQTAPPQSLHATTPHLIAAQRHRMRSDGQASPGIVRLEALARIHDGQGRRWGLSSSRLWALSFGFSDLGLVVARLEYLTRRTYGLLDLPQRAPPFVGERIQRSDIGQRRQLVTAQARAVRDVLDGRKPAGGFCHGATPCANGAVIRAAQSL